MILNKNGTKLNSKNNMNVENYNLFHMSDCDNININLLSESAEDDNPSGLRLQEMRVLHSNRWSSKSVDSNHNWRYQKAAVSQNNLENKRLLSSVLIEKFSEEIAKKNKKHLEIVSELQLSNEQLSVELRTALQKVAILEATCAFTEKDCKPFEENVSSQETIQHDSAIYKNNESSLSTVGSRFCLETKRLYRVDILHSVKDDDKKDEEVQTDECPGILEAAVRDCVDGPTCSLSEGNEGSGLRSSHNFAEKVILHSNGSERSELGEGLVRQGTSDSENISPAVNSPTGAGTDDMSCDTINLGNPTSVNNLPQQSKANFTESFLRLSCGVKQLVSLMNDSNVDISSQCRDKACEVSLALDECCSAHDNMRREVDEKTSLVQQLQIEATRKEQELRRRMGDYMEDRQILSAHTRILSAVLEQAKGVDADLRQELQKSVLLPRLSTWSVPEESSTE